MKNNILPLIAVAFIVTLGTTSCTKEKNSFTQEQTTLDFQTAIIGSWQLIEKGVETGPDNLHNCPYDNQSTENKLPTIIKWENAKIDESQDFRQNGEYNCYLKKQLGCKGTYKISNEGDLDINSNCQNNSVKIDGLTTVFLTVKDGSNYYKYRKID